MDPTSALEIALVACKQWHRGHHINGAKYTPEDLESIREAYKDSLEALLDWERLQGFLPDLDDLDYPES